MLFMPIMINICYKNNILSLNAITMYRILYRVLLNFYDRKVKVAC